MKRRRVLCNRRQAIAAVAAAAALLVVPGVRRARAFDEVDVLVRRFAAGRRPVSGRIRLELPDVVDGAGPVRMMVAVDGPVSDDLDMTELLVVAGGDPRMRVAQFRFAPASGIREVTTRIRLRSTQRVTALARMSDGTVAVTSKRVRVALGGLNW